MTHQNKLGASVVKREQLFISLYKKAFPAVAKYISKKGGNFEQAKDIFQDALIIYYEKTVAGSAVINVTEQAYIMGIVKHLWSQKFRENIKQTLLAPSEPNLTAEDNLRPSSARLVAYLETAGQKCMNILKAFYYDNLPVAEIAQLFGYSGVHSATVQKYKCMEKVRETIKEKSLVYEDFIE